MPTLRLEDGPPESVPDARSRASVQCHSRRLEAGIGGVPERETSEEGAPGGSRRGSGPGPFGAQEGEEGETATAKAKATTTAATASCGS